MRRFSAATVLTAALAVGAGSLSAVPATAAPLPAPASATALAPAATPALVERAAPAARGGAKPAPLRYTPPKGVRFNNPLGDAASRRRIIGHLIRTIDSVPGRQKIRIASWNIRSDAIADALVRAHNRGVSVRLVMDRLNANEDNPNDNIQRLGAVFNQREANRQPDMTSDITRCVSACRNRRGIAHAKYFLFSRAGKARHVVIQGSNNATDLAAHGQWNDVYTLHGDRGMYKTFERVFDEMMQDRLVANSYAAHRSGRRTAFFYPFKGAGASGDPLMDELNRIVCAGATGTSGTNGRTKIRIAQTSMHGDRGKAVAERIAQMWTRGCDIKIVYAVFGNEVLRILRNTSRGAVPIRQIAQDHDLDGVYDRYLHMKNMAVSGNYNGDTSAEVTWNGSANWTQVALASDEVVMKIFGRALRKRYADWVDYLYANPPRFTGRMAARADLARRTAVAQGIDPYSEMELD